MKKNILLILFCFTCDVLAKAMLPSQQNRSMGDSQWGTHIAPLLTAIAHTTGPILELGCGDFSTPILHGICSANKRFILSTDTSKNWIDLFTDLETNWHHFVYVPVFDDDWEKNSKPWLWDRIGVDRHWGVVLVDHRPGERRKVDIERLRNNADILVVHDTQFSGYGYESVLKLFKYRYTYRRYTTQTTIVSDTIDVRRFFVD